MTITGNTIIIFLVVFKVITLNALVAAEQPFPTMVIGDHKNLISAKDIAHRFGVPYPTLNHYTNLGFFSVVVKRGNKRFYQADEVKVKLRTITRLKNDGYPLRLIRKKLNGSR